MQVRWKSHHFAGAEGAGKYLARGMDREPRLPLEGSRRTMQRRVALGRTSTRWISFPLRGRQVQFECLIIDVKNLALLAELKFGCVEGARAQVYDLVGGYGSGLCERLVALLQRALLTVFGPASLRDHADFAKAFQQIGETLAVFLAHGGEFQA